MSKIAVLAIGGNSIGSDDVTFEEQHHIIRKTLGEIQSVLKKGYKIVITHGNGPQVGDVLLRSYLARESVPPMPLYACVAETQGVIGALIQIALRKILGKDCKVATLVTTVTVSAKDPAFKNPTKPIGPTVSKDNTDEIKKDEPSASFIEVKSRKYRRVVPSPKPIFIPEIESIKRLIEDNDIVIACGGGGIPIILDNEKTNFVDAVVDKDLTSEVLASGIGASLYVNLTDVKGAYVNFRSKNRQMLKKIKIENISELLESGSFGKGSMEPKVRAAILFAEKTGNKAVIASVGKMMDAFELKAGTIVYK